jgi:CheY-like chemotaxis protein
VTGAGHNPPTRVLVAVDDTGLRRVVSINLRRRAFDVTTVATGAEALRRVARDPAVAVVLDLRLPDLPALDVVTRVRELGGRPLLVLAEETYQAEIAAVLDAGADDYVTKPFGMDQLLARLWSALRRATPAAVRTEAFAVDLLTGKVTTPRGRPAFSLSQRLAARTSASGTGTWRRCGARSSRMHRGRATCSASQGSRIGSMAEPAPSRLLEETGVDRGGASVGRL